MKAEELRINNYIQLYRKPEDEEKSIFQIKSIYFDSLEELYFVELYDEFSCSIGGITPIELTEEWLIKTNIYTKWDAFGDKNWGGYIPFVGNKKLMLRYWNDEILITVCTINKKRGYWKSEYEIKIPLKYFHQLQNLYFALTGNELTIKI